MASSKRRAGFPYLRGYLPPACLHGPVERIRLVGVDGQFVGRATTADNGRFEIRAPAGRYELQVVVAGPYPRCDATPVSVRVGQMITIAVSCDSGMR